MFLLSFLKPGVLILFLGNILLFPQVSGPVNLCGISHGSDKVYVTSSFISMKEGKSAGYTSVISYKDGFLASGSGGKIDWISISGKITKSQSYPGERFNCILSDNKMIVTAGDQGILRISYDGETFRKIETGSVKNINSLTLFNRTIIAGAEKGTIIKGDPGGSFSEVKLDLKGNIVSVSSRLTDCYGVTDEGEIIHTKDGIHWDIIDFNKVYSGYYKTCYFKKVLVTEYQIAVAGVHSDGSPAVLFSTQGGVWTERPLNYTDDNGVNMFLSESPNDIIYDEVSNQFFIGCNRGQLMQLPSCSHCNKLASFQDEDIEGISLIDNTLLIVGSDSYIKSINIR